MPGKAASAKQYKEDRANGIYPKSLAAGESLLASYKTVRRVEGMEEMISWLEEYIEHVLRPEAMAKEADAKAKLEAKVCGSQDAGTAAERPNAEEAPKSSAKVHAQENLADAEEAKGSRSSKSRSAWRSFNPFCCGAPSKKYAPKHKVAPIPPACSREDSELLGVSLHFLLSDFARRAQLSTGESNPDFHTIAKSLCYGEGGAGLKKTCPRDGKIGCSFVDSLDANSKSKATHFLSWLWSYRLYLFVDTLREWVEKSGVDPNTTFLWICVFCNNQYRLQSEQKVGSHDLAEVFERRLKAIGNVLALLDTFENPSYLGRVWTVFEQFVAAKLKLPVTFILPRAEQDRLVETLGQNDGLRQVKGFLVNIDVEHARATEPADEEMVKDTIVATVGFAVVNEQVRDKMIGWVTEQFARYLSKTD